MKSFHQHTIHSADGTLVINEGEFKQIQFDAAVDGLTRYAWWKDGEQYVGTCGTKLKDAVTDLRRELGLLT